MRGGVVVPLASDDCSGLDGVRQCGWRLGGTGSRRQWVDGRWDAGRRPAGRTRSAHRVGAEREPEQHVLREEELGAGFVGWRGDLVRQERAA